MPRFRIQTPDGRIAVVEANDEASAMAGVKSTYAATADARKMVQAQDPRLRAANRGASFGFDDEVDAAAMAAKTGVQNLAKRIGIGQGKPYTAGQAYDSAMRTRKDEDAKFSKAHPVQSLAAEVAPAFATLRPGVGAIRSGAAALRDLPIIGGLLGGEGLGAVSGRAAATGGLLGGLSGAGNADVGQRLAGAGRGAVTGAAIGGAAPSVVNAAGSAVRAAGRAVGAVRPGQVAFDKISGALRRDGATPDQIRAAANEWLRTGASQPAFMDIVRNLPNGGEATLGLIRGAAIKAGPGRSAARTYANEVAGNLQDRAIDRTRRLTPNDQRQVPAVQEEINQRIVANSVDPNVPSGSGGTAVSDALNRRFDAANANVNHAYGAARQAEPERAALPASKIPLLGQRLREAVADFNPRDVPSVAAHLNDMDRMGTLTARDLFERRSQLSSLRMSQNPVEATAAGRAVRELDSFINDNADQFTGDPEAVGLWQSAIGSRREMGRQFEGRDLINELTERGLHGDSRTRLVAPEDASNVLLGRNGVIARPDGARDIGRIRNVLGDGSEEFRQLQREAQTRLLGPESGTENFGQRWQAFERQNPQLAQHLMSPEDRQALTRSREAIGGAVADRRGLETGTGILNARPDQFAADVRSLPGQTPNVQLGAARSYESAIGNPTEGAAGAINRIGTSTNQGQNLATAFGHEEAQLYQGALRNEASRLDNARFINPNFGSQTAGRVADDIDGFTPTKANLAKLLMEKLSNLPIGGLNDQERGAIVQSGIGQFDPQAVRQLEDALNRRFRIGSGAAVIGSEQGGRQ